MEALADTTILSWNIRGAQNSNAKRHMKELIRKHRPTFLVILETHVLFARLSSFMTNNGYTPIYIIEASGQSGGIWLLKHSADITTTTITDTNQYSITFTISRGTATSTCTCVYASPNYTLRPPFWTYLSNLSQTITGPWMLIGDFNETILPSEQRGGIYNHTRAAHFSNLMNNCNLLDITTTGGNFTWHRNRNGLRILSKKLDRGIANINWRLSFPEAFMEILCRLHSDHNPLLLRFGGLPLARGPRPFRFEAAWIDHEDYAGLVSRTWNSSNHNITAALDKVRENSIYFNQEVFGNIFQRKKHLERRLKGIQNYLERVDSYRHTLIEKELQREYNHTLFQEEMLWYQKSRENWVKFGDRNSSFFHAQTIIRRKRNRIHKLQLPNGICSSDADILQDEAQAFFKNLFCSTHQHQNHHFNEGLHPTIDENSKNSLTKPITKNEVSAALNTMKPYKAPGPDGFHCIFFKQYWHIVGEDVFLLVNNAFQTGYFDPAIADTLIALIPKIDPPQTFRDFRPISLCNIIYKIITKVLVHRLRPILNNIIGPYQSSFLPGRGTADNSIVLQEIVHFMRRSKKKKGHVAFKLDLEKAFDNVNWEFLSDCLQDFGFPNITIKLIMHCVTSPTFSILWNGNKLPPFKPNHGLRQGDPLSPYLFILCMEKLSISIHNSVLQGNWDPIRMSATSPHLSHLLFADDVLLFTKAKKSQIRFIKDLFDRFSKASGLKINLSKSRAFYSSGIPHHKINNLTSLSGIRCTTSLDKYLGFPILKGRPKRSDFNFIIDKMHTRLASWKSKLLNKPGRLTLATSVLSSIPAYYMQINWLPQSICDSIDQTTRNFIWRGSNDKGIHLVGWKKIAKPKNIGGLGIRSAREANICLLGKLIWDLIQRNDKLWVHMLSDKYSSGADIFTATSTSSSSAIWASIMRAKNVLVNGYSWRAGSGSSSFWFSRWSSFGCLGSQIPIIDIHDLHLSVKDVLSINGVRTQSLYSTLPQQIADFINTASFLFNDAIDDAFIWPHNKNGIYTTKSGYKWLISQSGSATNSNLSWSWIWHLKIPEKYKFLMWLACNNALPTLSVLNHRNISPSPTCSRCGLHDETFFHCMRDCSISRNIWHHIGFNTSNFFEIETVMDWLKEGTKGPHAALFASGLWWVWRCRNALCINNDQMTLHRVAANIWNSSETIKLSFPSSSVVQEDRHIRWNNNNFEGTILNVDGSCLGTPLRAGFGGLIRNTGGYYLAGFSGYLPASSDILQAELTAIYHGLSMARNMGFTDLKCYSDSLLAVSTIMKATSNYHVYAVLIHEIKALLLQTNASLHHTLREGNQCADFLAKLGASSDDTLLDHSRPPDDLRPLLRIDALGTLFLRS